MVRFDFRTPWDATLTSAIGSKPFDPHMGDDMSYFEQLKVQAMARAMQEAHRSSLAYRMPEVVPDDKLYQAIDISLKVWDVLNGLLEVAAISKLAVGAWGSAKISAEAIAASEMAAQAAATAGLSSKVTTALTAGEAMAIAGPLVAYIGLWVGLGAPYMEAKQKIAQDAARRGISQGVLVGAYGWSPDRARDFAMSQGTGINDNWIPGAQNVARSSYRMGFLAGYKQGRAMSQAQRKVFWKIFANTIRNSTWQLWENNWPESRFYNWFWEVGGLFDHRHLKN